MPARCMHVLVTCGLEGVECCRRSTVHMSQDIASIAFAPRVRASFFFMPILKSVRPAMTSTTPTLRILMCEIANQMKSRGPRLTHCLDQYKKQRIALSGKRGWGVKGCLTTVKMCGMHCKDERSDGTVPAPSPPATCSHRYPRHVGQERRCRCAERGFSAYYAD